MAEPMVAGSKPASKANSPTSQIIHSGHLKHSDDGKNRSLTSTPAIDKDSTNNTIAKLEAERSSTSLATSEETPAQIASAKNGEFQKGIDFWLIFLALCAATILVALDMSILATALPTIAADLKSAELFVWVSNSYTLSSTAIQPLYGQAANIFGRRSLTLFAVSTFLIGSGICGGASTTAMLIAGRSIQGVGGGGILSLGEIIMCDLVPLRERGKYTGLIAATYAIGTVLGPVLGGVFTEDVSWRWIFYINLPIGGIALVLIAFFFKLKYNRIGTLTSRIKRIDFIGNTLLIASVTSILLALSSAGTSHPWTSWLTLLPLILGFTGLLLFTALELSPLIPEPTLPRTVFSNRTSISIMAMSFFHGAILTWVAFFLSVYWQAVRTNTPLDAGLKSLPISGTIAPFAALAGFVLSITGTYRPAHLLGWTMITVSCGCLTTWDENTSTAAWVIVMLLFGTGCGAVYSTMLPPLLASLPPKDVATATSIWTFTRSFGTIWGVAVPAAIFNARVDTLVSQRLADFPGVAEMLVRGGAYERATRVFVESLGEGAGLRSLVRGVYLDALGPVWFASLAFAGLGFLTCLGVQGLELTMARDEDYGLESREERRGRRAGGGVEEKV